MQSVPDARHFSSAVRWTFDRRAGRPCARPRRRAVGTRCGRTNGLGRQRPNRQQRTARMGMWIIDDGRRDDDSSRRGCVRRRTPGRMDRHASGHLRDRLRLAHVWVGACGAVRAAAGPASAGPGRSASARARARLQHGSRLRGRDLVTAAVQILRLGSRSVPEHPGPALPGRRPPGPQAARLRRNGERGNQSTSSPETVPATTAPDCVAHRRSWPPSRT